MNDWDGTGPYIPERYRQQIAARKRREFMIKIGGILLFLVVCAALVVFLGPLVHGSQPATVSPSPQPTSPLKTVTASITTAAVSPAGNPEPTTTGTSGVQPTETTVSGPLLSSALIAAQQEPGILPYSQALAFLKEDFPDPEYTVTGADITTVAQNKREYAFLIQPLHNSTSGTSFTAYIDSLTGEPYTPGQDSAPISLASAKNTVADTFSGLHPDDTRLRYSNASGARYWNFTLVKNNATIMVGSMDGETGLITEFTKVVSLNGRPPVPTIDNGTAVKTAEQFIGDRNGPVSVNLTAEQYAPQGTADAPVAGTWTLQFSRLVQGYPCDADGFTITVDAVTGEVTGYERRWNAPEFAFEVAPDVLVMKRDATYTVLNKAQSMYPGLATGIDIISADIRWKDAHTAGTVPRPASIPLAWKVEFNDALIRAMPNPVPAVAWVDVQTGNIIATDYTH